MVAARVMPTSGSRRTSCRSSPRFLARSPRAFLVHRTYTPAPVIRVHRLGRASDRTGGAVLARKLADERRFRALATAVMLPLVWFASLPALIPTASAGPLATFRSFALDGLLWLIAVAGINALPPRGAEVLLWPTAQPEKSLTNVFRRGAGSCLLDRRACPPESAWRVRDSWPAGGRVRSAFTLWRARLGSTAFRPIWRL